MKLLRLFDSSGPRSSEITSARSFRASRLCVPAGYRAFRIRSAFPPVSRHRSVAAAALAESESSYFPRRRMIAAGSLSDSRCRALYSVE